METATGGTPAVDTSGSSVALPSSIGGYRIFGKLGEGGMGVVYEAQQRNPNRRVALKVVRGGAFVDEQRARMFQREADSLARLKHPNIGAIYESGRTEDGQHFFAMELVRGATLDVFLKNRPEAITPSELRYRLVLFRTIVDAVQYAHRRGVIHRDLKPSNIIVTEQGRQPEIKILDFGLARITDTDVAATSILSAVGVIKGTLAYMSPEQARGDPGEIDVRADVYALGVILYEMLVGSRPHDMQGKSLAEAVRVICEEPPRSLRQAWTATCKLDPDIETIVGTALEKDANRRYASAAALSDDVQRHLDSRPILARPPSTVYQLKKFARRHRTLVAATSVILLVLVVSLVITLRLYLRSETERVQKEREAARATAVVDFVLKDMIGAANPENAGHQVRVVDVLESAAESADERFADEPRLEGEIRNVLGRTYHGLGLYQESIEQFESAEALLSRSVGDDDIETIRALRGIGLGSRQAGDFERAESAGREALERARRVLGSDHTLTVLIGADLGEMLQSLGKHEEAEPILRETLPLLERTEGRDNQHTIQVLVSLAASLYAQRRLDEALVLQRDAVDRGVRAFGAGHAFTVAAMNNLANTLLTFEQYDEAVEVAMRLDETIDEVFPPEHPAHAFVALTCASGLKEIGRLAEASRYGQEAYDRFLASLGADRWETERAAYLNWGLARDLNDADAMEQWGLRTIGARLRVAGPGELESVTAHIERMESDLMNLGRTDAAAGLIARVAAGAEDSVPSPHPRRARYLGNLGRAIVALGRHEDAESLLLAAFDALPHSETAEEDRGTIGASLGDLYEARGDTDEAERWRRESGS